MGKLKGNKETYRKRRHLRVKRKISGTPDRPRLVVFRSLRHIYGQLVDDIQGVTLLGIASSSAAIRKGMKEDKGKIGVSRHAGKYLAKQAAESGIKKVVFDRGGYKYHGRVKAFAEGAREGGLEF